MRHGTVVYRSHSNWDALPADGVPDRAVAALGTAGLEVVAAQPFFKVHRLPRPAPVRELRDRAAAGLGFGGCRLFGDGGRVARFYAFLVRERLRPDLELELVRLRLGALWGKRLRGLPRVPADGAVERLVAAARAAPPGGTRAAECIRLRNVAIVETLRGSGLRVSELVSLKRGDPDRGQRRAVVTGKGGKQRLVFFTDPAWHAIESYLEARRDGAAGRGLAALPLFARHDARAGKKVLPLQTQAVREIVWELARRAQLEELGITPHRFRAWFATRMVAETGDLAATQDLLGHESADTTRVYTKVAAQRLAEAHRRAFAQ